MLIHEDLDSRALVIPGECTIDREGAAFIIQELGQLQHVLITSGLMEP